jgi:hypothetical protein
MPLKSRERREKMAKAAGSTEVLKDVDLGGDQMLSRHAAKKSRHNAIEATPPDRRVSRHEAPGEGQAKVPKRDASEAKDYYRSEAGSGTKPGHHRKEDR